MRRDSFDQAELWLTGTFAIALQMTHSIRKNECLTADSVIKSSGCLVIEARANGRDLAKDGW
jgi:hypothetical protein